MKILPMTLATAAIFVASVTPVMPAFATGIPVVDLAGNIDRRIQFTERMAKFVKQIGILMQQKKLLDNQLKELANIQSPLLRGQLAQLVNQYTQMLKEYEHYKRMIKGIKSVLSAEDYKKILISVNEKLRRNPLEGFDVSVATDDGFYDVDKEIENVYDRTKSIASLEDDLFETGLNEEDLDYTLEETKKQFTRSKLITSQMNAVKSIKGDMDSQEVAFQELEQARIKAATEGESQLQTLQFIALQNQFLIKSQQIQQRIAKDNFAHSNQLASSYYANIAKANQRRIEILKKRANETIEINNTGKSASF